MSSVGGQVYYGQDGSLLSITFDARDKVYGFTHTRYPSAPKWIVSLWIDGLHTATTERQWEWLLKLSRLCEVKKQLAIMKGEGMFVTRPFFVESSLGTTDCSGCFIFRTQHPLTVEWNVESSLLKVRKNLSKKPRWLSSRM